MSLRYNRTVNLGQPGNLITIYRADFTTFIFLMCRFKEGLRKKNLTTLHKKNKILLIIRN